MSGDRGHPRAMWLLPFAAAAARARLTLKRQTGAATGNVCPVSGKTDAAMGHAIAWLIGDSSRPRPSRLGEKRLGTFGSLPVRGGSSPVECCLPLVLAHVADPCRCRPLVEAGDTLVRLGCPAERLRSGGQHLGLRKQGRSGAKIEGISQDSIGASRCLIRSLCAIPRQAMVSVQSILVGWPKPCSSTERFGWS
jgi:hypothetical protein